MDVSLDQTLGTNGRVCKITVQRCNEDLLTMPSSLNSSNIHKLSFYEIIILNESCLTVCRTK
jgi:hypothetical protein